MYALYSKSFTKKAVDLNKKEFDDGSAMQHKLTMKTKTSDKVEFESNVSDKPDGDVKFTVPIDSSFKVGLKATATKDTEMDTEFKMDSNTTIKATLKNGSSMGTAILTGGIDYVTEAFSVETSFGVLDGPCLAKCSKTLGVKDVKFGTMGNTGASAAFAFDCPGAEFIKVGLQPGLCMVDKYKKEGDSNVADGMAVALNINYSAALEAKDYQLAVTGGFADVNTSAVFAGVGLKGWFKYSDVLQCAVEADMGGAKKMGKSMYSVADKGDRKTTIKLGLDYKVADKTNFKGKLTMSKAAEGKPTAPVVDIALKTALEGKSTATTFVNFGGEKPKFGFTVTIEG